MLDLIERINVRVAGLALAAGYTIFIIWVYWSQPQTIPCAGFERSAFEDGRESFERGELANARTQFDHADPKRCDAETQFYVAYSHYREGCRRGRPVSREQFELGLEAVNRAIELTFVQDMRVDDPGLNLPTLQQLKAELEGGPRFPLPRIRRCL